MTSGNARPSRRHIALLATLPLVLAAFGCASRVYKPHTLPTEYMAPPPQDVARLDLSRLVDETVSSDLVAEGDVISVTVSTDYNADTKPQEVRVRDDGTADVPLVGPVQVAGLRLPEAEEAIADTAIRRDVFRRPHVTVKKVQEKMNRVTVVGAVKEQGVYDLPRGSSNLLAALVKAGGLDDSASPIVEIRRPRLHGRRGSLFLPPEARPHTAGLSAAGVQPTSYAAGDTEPQSVKVNLVSAVQDARSQYTLGDGDVVMVVERDPSQIAVTGLVAAPGVFNLDLNRETRLTDAVAMAGGTPNPLADTVRIIRRVEDEGESVIIKCSLKKAGRSDVENPVLKPGDTIIVEHTASTFVYDAFMQLFRIGGSVTLF